MKLIGAPGSIPWMVTHEFRLWQRYLMAMMGSRRKALIWWGISIVLLLLMAVGVGFASKGLTPARMVRFEEPMLLMVSIGLAFMGAMMTASAINAAALVFHDRGDLDLLLSSPVKPRKVLAVRMMGMALNSLYSLLFFVLPFSLGPALIAGHWGWLGMLPVMGATSLLATAIGVTVAMALFRVLGPRRTRTAAQILAAVVGASVFLASQMPTIMGGGRRADRESVNAMRQWFRDHEVPAGLEFPAQGALGDLAGMALSLAIGVGGFALITWLLGGRFATDAAVAAGAGASSPVKAKAGPLRSFRGGKLRWIMVRKEMRILRRDPALISQVLLQLLYMVPLTFVILRSAAKATDQGIMGAAALAGGASMLTFLSGQIAAGLGWLTMSGEEAPEMLLTAPVTQQQTGYAKITAAVLPIVALVSIPALGIAWFSPWAGVCALVGATACATAVAFIELWTQKPGKRSEFRMRMKGSGAGWVFLLEFLLCSLIAGAVGLVAMGGFIASFAVIPAALAGAVLLFFKKDKWLNG